MSEGRPTKPPRGLRELLADEEGQAMTEYVILVAFTLIAMVAVFAAFPTVVRDYYVDVTRLLSFPVP